MDSGKAIRDMALEAKFGTMEPSMKDTGRITKLMAMVHSCMHTVISMKVIGNVIRPTAPASILIKTVQLMKDNGRMMCNMGTVLE